jgi:hypothetical protein
MGYKYEPNSLFRAGPRPKLNACFGTNGGPYNFGAYGEGFFEGGFQIINAIKRGEWTIDILIYPAAFSFRHGIELYLKHMVHLFDEIANSGAYTKTHSLQDNWSVFERQAIASKDGSFDPLELSIAKDIIDDFCNIDPTGQVFRYPEDIKGNKHLIGLGVINVEVLEDGMRVLHELFEGWRLALGVMRTSRP